MERAQKQKAPFLEPLADRVTPIPINHIAISMSLTSFGLMVDRNIHGSESFRVIG
jgi:hypothetical protein